MDKDRFCKLWDRCRGANGGGAESVFTELDEHYRQPHRYYHSGNHIDHCLSKMDMAMAEPGASGNPNLLDGIELAIWFHDVIYEPGAADNEQRSADWFAQRATGVLPPNIISRIEGYIMSTTHHEPPIDEGSKFVVDVDLSGFGLPPALFRRDGDNIRKEFDYMSETEFICGQTKFLKKLLGRSSIYSTSYFYDRYETRARQNINETIKRYAEWDC